MSPATTDPPTHHEFIDLTPEDLLLATFDALPPPAAPGAQTWEDALDALVAWTDFHEIDFYEAAWDLARRYANQGIRPAHLRTRWFTWHDGLSGTLATMQEHGLHTTLALMARPELGGEVPVRALLVGDPTGFPRAIVSATVDGWLRVSVIPGQEDHLPQPLLTRDPVRAAELVLRLTTRPGF